MGQRYPYYTIWKQIIVVTLHTYGARAVFLLFCNHQDNDYESRGTEIDVAGPIFTQKNTKVSMVQLYASSTIWEGKMC